MDDPNQRVPADRDAERDPAAPTGGEPLPGDPIRPGGDVPPGTSRADTTPPGSVPPRTPVPPPRGGGMGIWIIVIVVALVAVLYFTGVFGGADDSPPPPPPVEDEVPPGQTPADPFDPLPDVDPVETLPDADPVDPDLPDGVDGQEEPAIN